MSDYQQNRSMTPTSPVEVDDDPGKTLIHTMVNLTDQQGGPPLEEVTLWAYNADNAAQVLDVIFQGDSTIAVSIAANTIVKILDGAVFQYDPDATLPGAIQASNITKADKLFVWGTFTRA